MKDSRDQRIQTDKEWAKAKLRWVLCRIALQLEVEAPQVAKAIADMLRRYQ